ncbi:hypothetical protein STENM223S_00419 [Streptomyces tendae]
MEAGIPTGRRADSPKAAATAPSGEKPVSAGAAGIPAGFAHDRRGAESAAANYAVALVSADILKPARRAEIVRQVFVADKQASLEGRFDTAYSKEFLSSIGLDENGNAAPGDTYVSRTMPIGTKVTSYSDADATVDVWCSGVFGTAGEKTTNPVTSDWFTMTLQLRWADGDWKVDSFAQKDGPAPVPGDDKASTAAEWPRPSRSTEASPMPGSPRRVLKLATAVTAVQAALLMTAGRATAAPTPSPTPSDDNCDLIVGPAKDYCERGEGGSGGGGGERSTFNDPTSALDPLASLARGCADAASWTVKQLSAAVEDTAKVDFTNDTFLQQYAVVFAASTILTLLLWLLAVAKRAVREVCR